MSTTAYRRLLNGRANAVQTPKKVIHVGAIDYTLLLVVLILVTVGVIMIFSASYLTTASSSLYHNDMFYYLKKQVPVTVIGICAMTFMANFNYRYLRRFALPIYVTANVLLIVVKLFGDETKGAQRWIEVPIVGSIQPSEIAKVGVILMVSLIIASNRDILRKWGGFLFCCGIVGLSAFLVLLGNLSTAIIVSIIGVGIIFIASPYVLRFILMGSGAVTALVLYLKFFTSEDDAFRAGRFVAWLNPFDHLDGYGYQIVQSLFAIASGGMFGLGVGQSRQKTFIPEVQNDIIFSIICEELGFMGATILLLLFGILIWRGVRIAIHAPDTFSSLVASGIVVLVASQVIINVAVVTNSIPNTGVPLPFISYGGTSLVVTMSLMGILLNISRCQKGTA